MKQFPSNLKYKKYHKINSSYMYLLEQKNFFLYYGLFGLQSLSYGKLKYKQIEACRRTIRRGLKKQGKIFIRVFTSVAVSKKPIGTRMGKGKGSISYWISIINKGQVIFELYGIKENKARNILRKCIYQLPFKTKFIKLLY